MLALRNNGAEGEGMVASSEQVNQSIFLILSNGHGLLAGWSLGKAIIASRAVCLRSPGNSFLSPALPGSFHKLGGGGLNMDPE